MSGVDLLAMYRGASREVFRLETRQQYDVEAEAAQVRAFTEGRSLPPTPGVSESMEIIRAVTAAGVHLHRVHVIDLPLTPYLRYELAAYGENIVAGEQVSIAVRSWHRDLAALRDDFVFFDPGTDRQAVVWMRYDGQGRVTGRDYSDDPEDIARARHRRDIALARAVPLSEFTAVAEAV